MPNGERNLETLAFSLLTADAVRSRSRLLLKAGMDGTLTHFDLHPEHLPGLADYVTETIRQNYPSLAIPFHARWRHFMAAGHDLWRNIDEAVDWRSPQEKGRTAFDLAITSVLVDAGAGPNWRYHDAETGVVLSRSEGLGIASLRMFESGVFSNNADQPLRADAARLARMTAADIANGFQVTADNPLVGLEGRAALLRQLGETLLSDPAFTSQDTPRPGGLFDLLTSETEGRTLPAKNILQVLLRHLGPIWPGRITLEGVPMGDCWHHPQIRTGDATNGLVPFHKLSQWMAYSLIEPLQWTGSIVTDVDGLTGLPEYRNGGLFFDGGVIRLKNPKDALTAHEPGSLLIVEWRALTVALLDDIALLIRDRLGMDQQSLPLAKVLEGGTWSAGRRIARDKRPGGGPPFSVVSDGTVF